MKDEILQMAEPGKGLDLKIRGGIQLKTAYDPGQIRIKYNTNVFGMPCLLAGSTRKGCIIVSFSFPIKGGN